ncbi:MAG: hypothetical protein FWC47_07230 [Oscillospiraceae bacterium]|nr:hypothetical protein [Oscillospiraceae bacterium]
MPENTTLNDIISDVSETEKAIKNGTIVVYKTPDELFAAWDREDERL